MEFAGELAGVIGIVESVIIDGTEGVKRWEMRGIGKRMTDGECRG